MLDFHAINQRAAFIDTAAPPRKGSVDESGLAPSCYWRHAARQRNPRLRSARVQRDAHLVADFQRVWYANWQVYWADKVWLQMNREGIAVARYTEQLLMRALGLKGLGRGKTMRTTTPDTSAPCLLDHANRQFKASRPNELWVSDFTCVSTWQGLAVPGLRCGRVCPAHRGLAGQP